MATAIDWLYHRKHCDTCKRAKAWREESGVEAHETVDGTKVRFDDAGMLKLAKSVNTIIATKGPKIVTLAMSEKPTNEEILALIKGPTGNLRAPTVRVGSTLLIGFKKEIYETMFKG